MSRRRSSLLAWSLAGLSMILYIANIALYVLAHPGRPSSTIGTSLASALFLIFPVVGVLIASRRPGNPIGWVLLADGLVWIISDTTGYYADYGVARPGSVPFPVEVAAIISWLWVPGAGLLGTYVFLLFSDGRLPSGRWRPLA
jgi:hypothetical protein